MNKWEIYKFICDNRGNMVGVLARDRNPILQGLGLLIQYSVHEQILDLLDVGWVRNHLEKVIGFMQNPPDLGISVSEEIKATDNPR